MRRMSRTKIALTGSSVAALMVAGTYAAATAVELDEPVDEPTTVVNKNGKPVDEQAADGQARAAEARAAAAARKAAKEAAAEVEQSEPEASEAEGASEVEEVAEVEEPRGDNGNHGGPDDSAGDHPNENAFLNPQDHEPRGPKPEHTNNAGGLGPADGNGPSEHAGDHPNDHATDAKEDRGGNR